MHRPRKVVVKKQRALHTYAELWHASRCVLEVGQTSATGSAWQFLSSIVLTAFAFEAYLNHIGPKALASWPGVERLSPLSKFDLICEVLHVSYPQGYDARPLQTLVKLFNFRNDIAHGRSQTLQPEPILRDVNESLQSFIGEQPRADWERLVRTDSFAVRSRADVEACMERIHAARTDSKEQLFSLGSSFSTAVGT